MTIYVDADASPAKEEILLICKRHQLVPIFISNNPLPAYEGRADVKTVVVSAGFDAADNWIVENAKPGDLVLTADLLLAQRVVRNHVEAMNFSGSCFTDDVIHELVARREVQQYLREMNIADQKHYAYGKKNRSNLKASLHTWIETRKRRAQPPTNP